MTQSADTDDTQWLEALAGRPDSTARPETNREAFAVRIALETRAAILDKQVPEAGPELYERIRFRLRKEAKSRPPRKKDLAAEVGAVVGAVAPKISTVLGDWIGASWPDNDPRKRSRIWRRPAVWAVAAAIVLSVGIFLQLQPTLFDRDTSGEPGVERFATIVVAADPEARVSEILLGLRTSVGTSAVAGAMNNGVIGWAKTLFNSTIDHAARHSEKAPVVEDIGNNMIKLTIEARPASLDYLKSQGIEPIVTDERVVLIIAPQ